MTEDKIPGYCALSRKEGEKIYLIPKDAKRKEEVLEIIVAEMQSRRARIVIKAPENYVIVRGELVPDGNLDDYISGGQFLAERKANKRESEDTKYNR